MNEEEGEGTTLASANPKAPCVDIDREVVAAHATASHIPPVRFASFPRSLPQFDIDRNPQSPTMSPAYQFSSCDQRGASNIPRGALRSKARYLFVVHINRRYLLGDLVRLKATFGPSCANGSSVDLTKWRIRVSDVASRPSVDQHLFRHCRLVRPCRLIQKCARSIAETSSVQAEIMLASLPVNAVFPRQHIQVGAIHCFALSM